MKNHRLASAGYNWAFAALTHSPGARAHYDRRRARGDGHAAALRNLYNRFLGQLHHCLAHRPALRRTPRLPGLPGHPEAVRQDRSGSRCLTPVRIGCLDPERASVDHLVAVGVDEGHYLRDWRSSSPAKKIEARFRI